MDTYRVRADIDLDALAHNLGLIRDRVGPDLNIMLVVKADAYGHGAVAVAHHAVRCGIAALGVGNAAEALELRQAGLCVPILVLGTIVDEEAPLALRHGVQIGLHSRDRCRKLEELSRNMGVSARVHINVDTGWGQLGVDPGCALELLDDILRSDHLELGGVMTHMSAVEGTRDPVTAQQIGLFEDFLQRARARTASLGWVHAANSACIFTGLTPLYDTVRPGIGAYGFLPGSLAEEVGLRPVMSLKSQVVFLKDLPAGASVGYGSTWRASSHIRVATIPVGYNDGVSWRLSNCGEVLVRGKRAPIVGRVSMDYTTIDVTRIPGVTVGDEIVLIGTQGEEALAVRELAEKAGSIPHEITCSVGKRVSRIYRSRAGDPCRGGGPRSSPEQR